MATKAQVLALLKAHPDWCYQQIAHELNTSDPYVYKTIKKAGFIVPLKQDKVADPADLRRRAARLIERAEEIEARHAAGHGF